MTSTGGGKSAETAKGRRFGEDSDDDRPSNKRPTGTPQEDEKESDERSSSKRSRGSCSIIIWITLNF